MLQYRHTIAHSLHTRHIENCDSGCKERMFILSGELQHAICMSPHRCRSRRAPPAGRCDANVRHRSESHYFNPCFIDLHMQEIFLSTKSSSLALAPTQVCCWMGTGVLSALKRPGRGADRSAHLAPRWAMFLLRDMHSLCRQGEIYCVFVWSLVTCWIICLRSFDDIASSSDCTEPYNGMSR